MITGTTYIAQDEPCFLLCEMNLKSADQTKRRRYQIIYVIRDDKIAEYREDIGPASKIDQFRIPGGAIEDGRIHIEHTVAELKEIADIMRDKPSLDKFELVYG